jgi:DNA-directed RNA polymerase subunit beta
MDTIKKLFVNNIGDLAEIQRSSFYRFLRFGITEEINNLANPFFAKIFNPKETHHSEENLKLISRQKSLVYLFPNELSLEGPEFSFHSCLERDSSYTIQIYVNTEYTCIATFTLDKKNRKNAIKNKEINDNLNEVKNIQPLNFLSFSNDEIKNPLKNHQTINHIIPSNKKIPVPFIRLKQKMMLVEIPLMTEEGTFLINGCERIVISQIIRSPGVYFRKEFNIEGNKTIYTATLISNKGLWTKFYLDFKSKKEVSKMREAVKIINKWNKDDKRKHHPILRFEHYKKILTKYDDSVFIRMSDFKRSATQETQKMEKEKDERIYVTDLLHYFGLTLEEVKDTMIYRSHLQKRKVKLQLPQGFDYYQKIIPLLAANPNPQEFWLKWSIRYPKRKNRVGLDDYEIGQQNEKNGLEIEKKPGFGTNFSVWKKKWQRKNSKKKRAQKMALFIKKLFSNNNLNCFSIGEIGRYKINKRLGLSLPLRFTYLTSYDFIGIIDGLLELKHYEGISDDIDHIKNKLIRSVGDLLQLQIRSGLYRLQKNSFQKDDSGEDFNMFTDHRSWIIDPRPFTQCVKEFFKTSALSQYMDQINPLAELTHKRRISVFGPNGLKRDHISTVIRDIHPSQYGRLCPVETPEGQNAGLISSLALFGRIGKLGWIEAPYFFMKEKEIFTKKRAIYLNPEQESQTTVAFCDGCFHSFENINYDYLSTKEDYIFSFKKTEAVNFITPSPIQMISLATALIPFVEHNDANRALMGSNMQRQAVPLLYTQKPIIGTGFESVAIVDSGMVIKSYHEGFVGYASSTRIEIEDLSTQIIEYSLKKYLRSNQDTATNQRPIVWPGEKIFSGQVIADGPGTNDGELALGRNLTIAYMPWEGYNYEDAIVLNERLVIENCLTSVHIEEYEANLTNRVIAKEILTSRLPHLTKYIRRHLDKNGIVRLGSYVEEHDLLIGKLTPSTGEIGPERRFFQSVSKTLKPKGRIHYQDTSFRVHAGTEGRVIDIRFIAKNYWRPQDEINIIKEQNELINNFDINNLLEISNSENTKFIEVLNKEEETINENKFKKELFFNEHKTNHTENNLKIKKKKIKEKIKQKKKIKAKEDLEPSEKLKIGDFSETIRISIAQIRKIEIGDKLAGRHGNKGIISRILPSHDMPYLPDGTPIDILFNPLGVPSRMNVGQIFECLLGLAGEKLGNRFKILPFDEIYGREASRILVNQKLKETSMIPKLKWIFNPISPGKILLRDGRTGEYFDNPITVGKSYILKLIHLVDDKIHARATGPYAMITEQPLAGKSQNGGQRFGEMEVWALEAYGCANTLQELLTIKSDDIDGRLDMYQSLVQRTKTPKPNPSVSESFLALIRELQALGLDFSMQKIENTLKKNTKVQTKEKDLFKDIEQRLFLRTLYERKKMEKYGRISSIEIEEEKIQRSQEKQKIIERFKKKNL